MILSETRSGVAWLQNFQPEDRPLARRLLDSFVLTSWSSARASLLNLLRDELDSISGGPTWVLPAMDSGDIRKANNLPPSTQIAIHEDFNPGMDIPTMPGSEALVGHLIRDIQGSGVLPPGASIDRLRDERLRQVIVVTDAIETGGQIVKFVQAIFNNSTLKSWHSFGWIRLKVFTYAASASGAEAVAAVPEVSELKVIRQVPEIRHLPWARHDVNDALELCEQYARRKPALGYLRHGGLFGFQDRLPNTIPQIFRQSGEGWSPLFVGKSGRLLPNELVTELAQLEELPVDHEELIRAVRQERLAFNIKKYQRASNRVVLTTLSLLRVDPTRANILGAALRIEEAQVMDLLAFLHRQGWIDAAHAVTEAGKAELAAGRRKPRRVETRELHNSSRPYYPLSLR